MIKIDGKEFNLNEEANGKIQLVSKDNPAVNVKGIEIFSYRVNSYGCEYQVFMGLASYFGGKDRGEQPPIDFCIIKEPTVKNTINISGPQITKTMEIKELNPSGFENEVEMLIMEDTLYGKISLILDCDEFCYKVYKNKKYNIRVWVHKLDNHSVYIGRREDGNQYLFDDLIFINDKVAICKSVTCLDNLIEDYEINNEFKTQVIKF